MAAAVPAAGPTVFNSSAVPGPEAGGDAATGACAGAPSAAGSASAAPGAVPGVVGCSETGADGGGAASIATGGGGSCGTGGRAASGGGGVCPALSRWLCWPNNAAERARLLAWRSWA